MLTASETKRLVKMLRRTGSTNDGEALSAARKANAILAGNGLQWQDIIVMPQADSAETVQSDQTYIESVMARLARGKPHSSLGPVLEERNEGKGAQMFESVVAMGIKEHDVVVDYGCGTLRVGTHFIAFLDTGRYFGLDIDQRLLDIGASMLPGHLARKKPVLRVISDAAIAEVAQARPDWIFSIGVVQHLRPEELADFFSRIGALAHEKTTALVRVSKLEPAARQLSKHTWSHALTDLKQAITTAGLKLEQFQSGDNKKGTLILRKA